MKQMRYTSDPLNDLSASWLTPFSRNTFWVDIKFKDRREKILNDT